MKRHLFIVSAFVLLIAIASCSSQPSLKPPDDSSGNAIPLYPNAQTLTISQEDSESLISDLLGSEFLRYSSNTRISLTEDTAGQVQEKLDKLIPDAKWRLESDWFNFDRSVKVSIWRSGDLRASIILIDNLNSEQINNFTRYYGLSGLKSGATLIKFVAPIAAGFLPITGTTVVIAQLDASENSIALYCTVSTTRRYKL